VFRSLVPVLSTLFMIVGNAVTVVLSDWITAMNFNGRVTEAWKKAYLRPAMIRSTIETKNAGAAGPGGHGRGGGGDGGVLTHGKEMAADHESKSQAAMHGTLSATLEPRVAASATKARRARDPLSGGRFPQPPSSTKTVSGSFAGSSIGGDDVAGDLDAPLLGKGATAAASAPADTRGSDAAPFFALRTK